MEIKANSIKRGGMIYPVTHDLIHELNVALKSDVANGVISVDTQEVIDGVKTTIKSLLKRDEVFVNMMINNLEAAPNMTVSCGLCGAVLHNPEPGDLSAFATYHMKKKLCAKAEMYDTGRISTVVEKLVSNSERRKKLLDNAISDLIRDDELHVEGDNDNLDTTSKDD